MEWIAPCGNLFDGQDRQGLNLPQDSRETGGSLEETPIPTIRQLHLSQVDGRQPGVCRGDWEADSQGNNLYKHKSSAGQASCTSAF